MPLSGGLTSVRSRKFSAGQSRVDFRLRRLWGKRGHPLRTGERSLLLRRFAKIALPNERLIGAR